jgi:tetratricopeptide (TPR) repeat protein
MSRARTSRRRAAGVRSRLLVPLAALAALGALAAAPSTAAAAPAARAALPRLASTALPPPAPELARELDAALAKAASAKEDERQAGLTALREAGPSMLPAIARKLGELRKSLDREAAAALITEARKRGRSAKGPQAGEGAPAGKGKAAGDEGEGAGREAGGDWLAFVTAAPRPGDAAYRDLVAVLAAERALVEIGTTPAVRELVNVFVYFGDLFRVDVQHMVARLGDRALPALLEARRHDAEKVRRWAAGRLDALGKAIPGEAVQVTDPQVLADVLRAYGRGRDVDALRVIVSFAGSDRAQVRDAAREALSNYGDAAVWQLREAYENLLGQRPPPGSPWDKLAAELFEAHDRARLAEVYALFDEGLELGRAGRLDEMADRFDRVLARAPTFERRAEMVPGYLSLARSVDAADPAKALVLARKALRLDPEGAHAKALASYVLTLEGEAQLARGLADAVPFQRAAELDASNGRARADLARLERGPGLAPPGVYRYAAAAAVALVALAGAIFLRPWRGAPPAEKAG